MDTSRKRGRLALALGWLRRIVLAVLLFVTLYVTWCVVGLYPVNQDFQDADQGIAVFVLSSPVHTDFIVPLDAGGHDLRAFLPMDQLAGRHAGASHLVVGWGDREFYLATPTWADVKISSVLNAMLRPTSCVMHIDFRGRPRETERCCRVVLSNQQYDRLMEHICRSFRRDGDGDLSLIPDAGYSTSDAFFEAEGCYHLFNTCNCWTGRGLKRAGAPTGLWTPFPYWVMRHLHADDESPNTRLDR